MTFHFSSANKNHLFSILPTSRVRPSLRNRPNSYETLKNDDNGIKHVINEFKKIKTERNILLGELNEIINTNYEDLLNAIKYHYYSKRYSNAKIEIKNDNRGVKLIKEFLLIMYRNR